MPNHEDPFPWSHIIPHGLPDFADNRHHCGGIRPRRPFATHLQRPHGRLVDPDEGRRAPYGQVVYAGWLDEEELMDYFVAQFPAPFSSSVVSTASGSSSC